MEKKSRNNKNAKKSRYYVNNPKLQSAIIEWYNKDCDHEKDEIPNAIVNAIFHPDVGIIYRLATSYRFNGYSYKDEMILDAIEVCIKAIRFKKYDPFRYENPMAYFTQISFNAFVNRINIEKKEQMKKIKNLVDYKHMLDIENQTMYIPEDDYTNRLIAEYEEKVKEKKEKVKKRVKKKEDKLSIFYRGVDHD